MSNHGIALRKKGRDQPLPCRTAKAEPHHQAKLLRLIRHHHHHPNLLGEIREEVGKLQQLILYRLSRKKVNYHLTLEKLIADCCFHI